MIRINLAPPSAKKAFAVPDFNLGMLFGVLALGLILILGGWWWSVSAEIRRLNNEIAENKRQAEQLKVVIAESQRFQRDKEALERRVNAIEVVARPGHAAGVPPGRGGRPAPQGSLADPDGGERHAAEIRGHHLQRHLPLRLHVQPQGERKVQGRRHRRRQAGPDQVATLDHLRGGRAVRALIVGAFDPIINAPPQHKLIFGTMVLVIVGALGYFFLISGARGGARHPVPGE
jgi:hypothetical protein